jgi:hypothetical protein
VKILENLEYTISNYHQIIITMNIQNSQVKIICIDGEFYVPLASFDSCRTILNMKLDTVNVIEEFNINLNFKKNDFLNFLKFVKTPRLFLAEETTSRALKNVFKICDYLDYECNPSVARCFYKRIIYVNLKNWKECIELIKIQPAIRKFIKKSKKYMSMFEKLEMSNEKILVATKLFRETNNHIKMMSEFFDYKITHPSLLRLIDELDQRVAHFIQYLPSKDNVDKNYKICLFEELENYFKIRKVDKDYELIDILEDSTSDIAFVKDSGFWANILHNY